MQTRRATAAMFSRSLSERLTSIPRGISNILEQKWRTWVRRECVMIAKAWSAVSVKMISSVAE